VSSCLVSSLPRGTVEQPSGHSDAADDHHRLAQLKVHFLAHLNARQHATSDLVAGTPVARTRGGAANIGLPAAANVSANEAFEPQLIYLCTR
jgi:hypothetical protein